MLFSRQKGLFCSNLFFLFLCACSQEYRTGGDFTETEIQASRAEKGQRRPNIVLILADDLGYGDVGVFGGEIPTPNIDTLANQGMLLTNFYTGMTCSPTRAMLMSGTDNHLAGLGVMSPPSREDQKNQPGYEAYLNFRVASLADLMTDAGYNTYITGKWHLGDRIDNGPADDPYERHDLGSEHPDKLTQMIKSWDQYVEENGVIY